MKKERKNEEIWIHTQNPRRFPGFTVVVMAVFVKILNDFQVCFGMCLFPDESQQPVLQGQRFS